LSDKLAYGFRSRRLLEPIGPLGDDEGLDIMGVEAPVAAGSAAARTRPAHLAPGCHEP
jgi:hypothetical protein